MDGAAILDEDAMERAPPTLRSALDEVLRSSKHVGRPVTIEERDAIKSFLREINGKDVRYPLVVEASGRYFEILFIS